MSFISYNVSEYLYFYKMKTFRMSCRKVKIFISPRGGNFQFSTRCERYVYLKKTHPGVNFTSPTCNVHFVLSILFVLTLAFERGVLSGKEAFSMVVLSTKTHHSRFSKKLFVFQKTCFNVRVMKTSKTSSGCNIKKCQSLKRRTI